MLKLMGKKNLQFYAENFCLSKPVLTSSYSRANCSKCCLPDRVVNKICCLMVIRHTTVLFLQKKNERFFSKFRIYFYEEFQCFKS